MCENTTDCTTFCRVPLRSICTWQTPKHISSPTQTEPTEQELWGSYTSLSHPLLTAWKHLCWNRHRLVFKTIILYTKQLIWSIWYHSPDFAPNPDRELNVIETKNEKNPANMSTTRAKLWFTMVMVAGQSPHRVFTTTFTPNHSFLDMWKSTVRSIRFNRKSRSLKKGTESTYHYVLKLYAINGVIAFYCPALIFCYLSRS